MSSGGALSTVCGCVPQGSFGCVPPLDSTPLASGGRPFGGIGFIARCLRRPEKGNADEGRGIFGTACRVGLRPCDRTHLKNGIVPHSYAGGAIFSGVWVTSGWPCRAERFSQVWLCIGDTSGLRLLYPQALTLLGGVRFIAWLLRCPQKGNADGDRGIFGTAGHVWASTLRLDSPKNGLVPYSYAGGVYDKYRHAFHSEALVAES